jgi:hypothetical protein
MACTPSCHHPICSHAHPRTDVSLRAPQALLLGQSSVHDDAGHACFDSALGGTDVVAPARDGARAVKQHHAQSFAPTISGTKRGGRANSSNISTSTASASRAVAGRGGGGRTSTASASRAGGGSGGGGRVGAGRAQPSMSESGYQLGAKPRKGGLQQSSSVSESDVATLVAMGFDRHAAASALRDAGGDVQGAIDMLTS